MSQLKQDKTDLAALVSDLIARLQSIEAELALDPRTSPEAQLKAPLGDFLAGVSETLGRKVRVATEHRQLAGDAVENVRLDLAIKREQGQLIGHVELKSTSKSANPYRPGGWSKHDKSQWEKLERHPNLIYSNGWEWTLLRQGAGKPIAHVSLKTDADQSVPALQLEALKDLLTQFLSWKPLVPSSPRALADQLAPLTAFLRDSVVDALKTAPENGMGLPALYQKWQADLIPGATEKDFADSFAQTFTYALLLARIESDKESESFHASLVTDSLRSNGHKLIGSVLELMSQPGNRAPVEGPVSLLESVIGAVDAKKLTAKTDPWLYFYEDFLAAYDPKMRNDAGVYYTPVEIVRMQVRFLDDILRSRFGRQRGLGSDDVNVLDPAVGTGAYLLAVAEHVLNGSPAVHDDARKLAKRLFGFELLVGPYSVAHLRLTQMLEQTGVNLGIDGVQVFLTNSLTSPGEISADYQQISLWEIEQNLTEETRRAGLVKNQQTPIRVILGNPPYDRGKKDKALGTGSSKFKNVILEETDGHSPLLDDFIEPLKKIGAGGQAKNLYNSYVYFMRWAIWKACEQHKDEAGVVSFITSSSYLRGPGFVGLREYMRRAFDEIWIVDLGGEGRGAHTEESVFSIRTPVAIFFGIQWEKTSNGTPKKHSDRMKQKARVRYVRFDGSRKEKFTALDRLQSPDKSNEWLTLSDDDWHGKFVPDSRASLSSFVPLNWIFPWSQSGAQFKRKWPIGSTPTVLSQRWSALFASGEVDRSAFVEATDLNADAQKNDVLTLKPLPKLTDSDALGSMVKPVRYGYRSFDRQWCLPDHRVGTYIRQYFWDSASSNQLFFATLTANQLGAGPALTVSPYVPDMDFFANRGAKDIHPLYRTSDTSDPNVSSQLLSALQEAYARSVTPEDIAAYTFALLGTSAYTTLFEDELKESAARVPLTSDVELFEEVAEFGRSLIFEQTWGERCGDLNEFGQARRTRYVGQAKATTDTPPTPYPASWSYDPVSHELTVGSGVFAHVTPEVEEYSVSGMNVLRSWLGYRMHVSAGTKSSRLDRIQNDEWTLDRELLELLWQIEFFVNAEIEANDLLKRVVNSELLPLAKLSQPSRESTLKPKARKAAQGTIF